jgi:hypothetical protein
MQEATITFRVKFDPSYFSNPPALWDWRELLSVPHQILSLTTIRVFQPTSNTPPSLPSELTAEELNRFMYSDEAYEQCGRLSCLAVEWNAFPIKVVTPEVGRVLANVTNADKVWHIAFFSDRAEVWRLEDWTRSKTNRWEGARFASNKPTDTLVLRRHDIYEDLVAFFMTKTRGPTANRANAEKVAELLLSFGNANDGILDLFSYPKDKRAQLENYRAQLAAITAENSPSSTTITPQ